jgi:hypothetical protein
LPALLPSSSLQVHVTLLATQRIPAAIFSPLGSSATFVSASGGGDAVLSTEELIKGVQVLTPKDAADFPGLLRSAGSGPIVQIASLDGSLPPGVTADFSAADPDSVMDPVTALRAHRKLEVMAVRPRDPSDVPRIALVVTDLTNANPPEFRSERALFDLPSTDTGIIGLIVPFRFDHAQSPCTAILVSISPGSQEADHVVATNRCLQQVSDHLKQKQLAVSSGGAARDATLAAAFAGLKSSNNRRSSLAFLANQTGASLCEDLALEADDSLLKQLTDSITADPTQPPALIGWQLDHASLALLAKLLEASSNGTGGEKMPDELDEILIAHTGEVGRHPSSLTDVLAGLTNRQELDNRLVAENIIFLQDVSPASRVRAYDWLKSHGHDPVGFDPLATAAQRQDQLDRAANPAVTVPTTAPTGTP